MPGSRAGQSLFEWPGRWLKGARGEVGARHLSKASLVGDAELHGNSLVGVPDYTPLRPPDPDPLADRRSRLKLEAGAAQGKIEDAAGMHFAV